MVNALLFITMVPVLVHQLGVDGYGEYTLFQVYSGLVLSIFSGLHSYALYVGSSQNNELHMTEAKWHNVFNHLMQSGTILMSVAIIAYILTSLNLFSPVAFPFQLLVFVVFRIFVSIIETQYAINEEFRVIAFLETLRVALRLLMVLVLSYYLDLATALFAFAFTEILLISCVFLYNYKRIRNTRTTCKSSFEKYKKWMWLDQLLSREAKKFILGASYNNIINSLTVDLDKILINRLLGVEALGIYQLAFALYTRVADLINTAGQVLLPKILKQDEPVFKNFITKTDNLLTLAIGIFATFVSYIFGEFFYNYWLSNPSTQTVYIFKMMSIAFVFVAINQLTGNELVRCNEQHMNGHIKLIVLGLLNIFFGIFAESLLQFSSYQALTLILITVFQLVYITRKKK